MTAVTLSSCSVDGTHEAPVKDPIRMTVGAYSDENTKADYEYDESTGRRRMVWSPGDALSVASFTDGVRTTTEGAAWSRYDMISDDAGFDREYAEFSGEALIPDDATGTISQSLYAVYPAEAVADNTADTIRFPSVQTYYPDSFDEKAVLLLSDALEVSVNTDNPQAEAGAFRFRHHTGYLHLKPDNLPESIAAETVSTVTLSADEGIPVAGDFGIAIDPATSEWTLTAGTATTDEITLDFDEAAITVGELTDIWFSLLPGKYDKITFTITTVQESRVCMTREGLEIKSGVLKETGISFGTGDEFIRTESISLDGNDLGLKASNTSQLTTETKNGIRFTYKDLSYKTSQEAKHISFKAKTGILYNADPLPGDIVRIEIDITENAPAKYTYVSFGTETDIYETEGLKGESAGVNTFRPDENISCRYFRIENKSPLYAATASSIKIYYSVPQ